MSHSSCTRRALVTGASGAIGGAIARALAAQGLHVLAHANRNRAAADEVVAAIHATGGAAESVVFDVTDGPACSKALAEMLEAGPIQVLTACPT